MTTQCIDTSCDLNCCNYYGFCIDENSKDTYAQNCYYFYTDDTSFPLWTIGPIILAIVMVVGAVYLCYWRCQPEEEKTVREKIGNTEGEMGKNNKVTITPNESYPPNFAIDEQNPYPAL